MRTVAVSPTKTRFGPLLFAGRLEEGLPRIRELGFDGVELSLGNPDRFDLQHIKNLLGRGKLVVSTIATGQSYYDEGLSLSHPDPATRQGAIARIRTLTDYAAELGAKLIIGGIRGKSADHPGAGEPHLLDALGECLKYAEVKGTVLLLEPINRYETDLINTLEAARAVIDRLGSENLKILPDTFHMNIEEASLEASLWQARDYLGGLHIADSNRLAPGWGHTDFRPIAAMLERAHFQEFICAEVLPLPNDNAAAEQTIEFMRQLAI